jgi:hypothetical protein
MRVASGDPKRKAVAFAGEGRDCQSVETGSVSKILFRSTPARAISARSNALAAEDMAIFIIACTPPDRRERVRWFAAAGRGRFEDRIQIVDPQRLPCRIVSGAYHFGVESVPLL